MGNIYEGELEDYEGNVLRPFASSSSEIDIEEATKLENIKKGDKYKRAWGIIKKWYESFASVVWSGSYNDLKDKPEMGTLSGILPITKGGTGASNAANARANLGMQAAATYPVANNDTTNRADMLCTAQVAYQHGQEIDQLSSDLKMLNDSGAIKGFDAREDGLYATYVPASGADAVTKKLGSGKIEVPSYSASGRGNNGSHMHFTLNGQKKLTIRSMDFNNSDDLYKSLKIYADNTLLREYRYNTSNVSLDIPDASLIKFEYGGWSNDQERSMNVYGIVIE